MKERREVRHWLWNLGHWLGWPYSWCQLFFSGGLAACCQVLILAVLVLNLIHGWLDQFGERTACHVGVESGTWSFSSFCSVLRTTAIKNYLRLFSTVMIKVIHNCRQVHPGLRKQQTMTASLMRNASVGSAWYNTRRHSSTRSHGSSGWTGPSRSSREGLPRLLHQSRHGPNPSPSSGKPSIIEKD
jgi:hypothetical protein